MKNFKWWPALTGALVSVVLAGCGGGSSSGSGAVRLVNATLTHPSLDLLVTSNSAKLASAVTLDTVSTYAGLSTTATPLQIDDAGVLTSLATTTPAVAKDLHYALVAYETGGAVKTALLSEEITLPVAGSSILRIFDAAIDAGSLDVYVTAAGTTLASGAAPSVQFTSAAFAQSSGLLSFTPGTYSVLVTGAGDKTDIRLTIPSVTLTDQVVQTVLLTPTTGGVQVNGSVLIQQGAITGARNANARVRLVTSVTGTSTVSAAAGSTIISAGSVSPVVGVYTTVPVTGALSVLVNNVAANMPGTALVAGTDSTLLVYGTADAPVVSVIADDNHLPTVTTAAKMRLVNGVQSAASGLTFTANAGIVAANVLPGFGSTYGLVANGTTIEFDVNSPETTVPFCQTLTNQTVLGDAVYSLFALNLSSGEGTTCILRRDRAGP